MKIKPFFAWIIVNREYPKECYSREIFTLEYDAKVILKQFKRDTPKKKLFIKRVTVK